jgi:hypothetical protein
MHWAILFYLAYIWNTRALAYIWNTRASTTTIVKSCADCKFFLPPTDDLHNPSTLRMGKCLLYPYSDKMIHHLIVGMGQSIEESQYRYATTARMSETMCGNEGVNFIPKNTRYNTPRYKW